MVTLFKFCKLENRYSTYWQIFPRFLYAVYFAHPSDPAPANRAAANDDGAEYTRFAGMFVGALM